MHYIIAILISFATTTIWAQDTLGDPVRHIDPFIGTQGEGNTFPGATLPFGMVKLGPDCAHRRANAGYIPDSIIRGFSHTHVSGTGGGAKYGNISVMPFIDSFSLSNIGDYPIQYDASPGYLGVSLSNSAVDVELTATEHAGHHRYIFPAKPNKGIIIDAGSFLGAGHCCGEAQKLIGSEVQIVSDHEIQGYTRVSGGWNMGGAYTIYFYGQLSRSADSVGVWQHNTIYPNQRNTYDKGLKTGAYFIFNDSLQFDLQVKIGISHISTQKAKANLHHEIPHWNFEQTHQQAISKWQKALNAIDISTDNKDYKTMFYTALYHTMLMPTDKTDENPLWNTGEPYFDDFYAIWDTYRVTNPLLTLIRPDISLRIIRSLLDIYDHEGYLPDSRSGNHTGRTQGGSNSDMVLADAILKDLGGFDYERAYQAMITNAEIPPGGNQQKHGRGGLMPYKTLGYVSTEYEPKSKAPSLHTPQLYDRAGTRTVEYAANDMAIALVAQQLDKTEDYKLYKNRANNWTNLWNKNITAEGARGFIWPKNKNGQWIEDYQVERYGSWGNFVYEANTWEYSFYVPHDVAALIDSCGGQEMFLARLDTFFANDHFQVSNEPSFFTPCLYTYAGRQDKTNATIRSIIADHYTAEHDGIPGNDDAGSMSAWLVFNMLGFFPNAGQDIYIITAPHFESAKIQLADEKELLITAHNLSDQNTYIKNVALNGSPLNRAWFRHSEIADGATLEFFMTDKPDNSWVAELPPSY